MTADVPHLDTTCRQTRLVRVVMTRPNGGGVGGMDRLADNICAETRALAQARIEIVPITTRHPRFFAIACVKFGVAYARIVARALSRRMDLLHLNVSSEGSVARKRWLGALAYELGVPYVVHLHSDRIIQYWTSASPQRQAKIVRFLHQSSSIIVLGRMWAGFLNDRDRTLGPKITILPNATARVEARSHVDANRPVHIVSLGLLGPRKGTRVLLAAFALIKDDPRWRATLAGDGDVAQSREYAAELGLGDRVSIPGWIGADATRALLGETDIFALPSNSEGLPMAILEAMSYAIPVVATDVGAVTDVTEDGITGLIVPRNDPQKLADALRQLILSPDLRARMGARARQKHAEQYQFDVYMARLTSLWREVAARSRKR
jgi:glycosyltransferase involved in cell wall biosynthesis